jgi:hypothetical protein
MVSRGATWTMRPGLRWFVRGAAAIVGLANLVCVVLWFVGGLYVLGGEEAALMCEALPSAIAAVVASLATSEIVLRKFELPGGGFWHRYWVVVTSVCIGGMIEGGLLAWVFSVDGTLFPESPLSFYPNPVTLLGALVYTLLVGLLGAEIGLVIGLAEGLVLGLPLAAMLGALRSA